MGPRDSLERSILSAPAGNETPGLWSSQQPRHYPERVQNHQNQRCSRYDGGSGAATQGGGVQAVVIQIF